MSILHDKLAVLLPPWRNTIDGLVREHGAQRIDSVSVAQVYGGMRGIHGIVCDTSEVDPQAGLIIRGRPVLELAQRLPEEVFWLLLTGELPDATELSALQAQLTARPPLPAYVGKVLAALPADTHPVTQYGAALLALQGESHFAAAYGSVAKSELWRPALDDALSLLAWGPQTAALVYRRHGAGAAAHALPGDGNDYAQRVSFALDPSHNAVLTELLRLHFVVHSDHESGSASAFACHTVGSALADPYLAVASSLGALAGPVHGMASQTCLEFVVALRAELWPGRASDAEVARACWERLNAKQIIPGFGHAVLRDVDPRFTALHAFGRRHFAGAPLFEVADILYRVAPAVLAEQGSAKSVQPNVDGISGVLLNCAGIDYAPFYTVMFSLGQMLGLLAQYVLARGLGTPIMRPRSASQAQLRALAASAPS